MGDFKRILVEVRSMAVDPLPKPKRTASEALRVAIQQKSNGILSDKQRSNASGSRNRGFADMTCSSCSRYHNDCEVRHASKDCGYDYEPGSLG